MAKQKIIRTGNSLAVTVPSFLARSVGIKAGQEVEVWIEPDKGKMVCHFFGNAQLSLIAVSKPIYRISFAIVKKRK